MRTRTVKNVPRAPSVALVLGLAAAAFAPPAAAYVRYTSDSGVMFAWPQSCVLITAYPTDFVSVMPLDEIENAMGSAAFVWTGAADPCTYLSISVSSSMAAAPRAINDHRNSIIFRVSSWCELLPDGTCSADVGAYDQAALAVTSVVANKQSGQIRDADIEINAFHRPWGDLVAHPELFVADSRTQDLQNALTHEMGHLIGLDHTCVPAGTVPRPVDNLGNPVPDCNTASADVQATTMFPSAQPGDTEKRSLAPDDQLAVCEIYPTASDPKVCMPDEASGCSCAAAGGSGAPGPAGLALGLAGLTLLRARRRRGRCR